MSNRTISLRSIRDNSQTQLSITATNEDSSLYLVTQDEKPLKPLGLSLVSATNLLNKCLTQLALEGFIPQNVGESVELHCTEGSSDKVYFAQLSPDSEATALFTVTVQYGARGKTLNSLTKTANPIDYVSAKKLYDKIVREKLGKGYVLKESGSGALVKKPLTDKIDSGVRLSLLNPISLEQAIALIHDNNYVAQEKYDGHRRAVRISKDGSEGINLKGFLANLPEDVTALLDAQLDSLADSLFDGELLNSRVVIFDALRISGTEIRHLAVSVRLQWLKEALEPYVQKGVVEIAPVAHTTEEKQALFDRVKAEGKEGLVFKRKDASYVEGVPASGGPYLKFKFVHSASVIVTSVHSTKRSVGISVLDENEVRVIVGNVAIPANAEIPAIDDIIDVRYLYAFPQGSLYQPIYIHPRDDVDASACKMDKLRYKPKDD